MVVITRTAHSPLSPSYLLLKDWKVGIIEWDEYEKRYTAEISGSENAEFALNEIINLILNGNTVWLVCYEKNPPCHRFILQDIIRNRITEIFEKNGGII